MGTVRTTVGTVGTVEGACGACGAACVDGHLCWRCTGRVGDALDSLARYLPELWTAASGMTGAGPRIGTVSRSGHGPGIHVAALDVADDVRQLVRAMARDLTGTGYVSRVELPPRADTAAADCVALVRFLAGHMSALRQHPAAPDWHDELTQSARAVWLDPATGERVEFTRPPLVAYVLAAIDSHREARPLDPAAMRRAADAAGAWVTIPQLVAALPMLLDEDTPPPNRRTIYEWANGRKATATRRAVAPRLFTLDGRVCVSAVLALIRGRDERAAS